jgi:hypothetical protein
MVRLDALLRVRDGRTDFNRLKETPRQATLQHLQQWTQRLTWLESILPTRPFLTEIAHTKIQQFAAEASALEVGDMRNIHHRSRRYSLLICFLYHAQTRDQLVEMLLKRMRRTTWLGRELALCALREPGGVGWATGWARRRWKRPFGLLILGDRQRTKRTPPEPHGTTRYWRGLPKSAR